MTAGFLPPPAPSNTAAQVAAFYLEHSSRIRIGMVLLLLGAAFDLPWTIVISLQMWRTEGRFAPLTLLQFASGVVGIAFFVLPPSLWLVAAYRPLERSPETIQTLNDLGWLPLLGVFGPIMAQQLSIAVAALRGPSAFPRWVGYFNLWCALANPCGGAVWFFTSGPLAWNGLIGFWIPAAAFGTWILVMFPILRRAITEQAAGA